MPINPLTKSIVSALLAVFALTGIVSALPPDEKMFDPFAMFKFPATEDRYERVAKENYAKYDLWDGPHWIFASYVDEEEGAHYVVTSGFITAWLDTEPPKPGPLEVDFGVLLKGKNGVYKTLGTADSISEPSEELSAKAIKGLLDDFVARSLKGFGGVKALQNMIDKGSNHPWMWPCVADALGRAGVVVPETMQLLEKWRKGMFYEIPPGYTPEKK